MARPIDPLLLTQPTQPGGLPALVENRNGHDPSTILAPTQDLPNLGGDSLGTIVQPEVKDRWLGLIRRNYDAASVRATLESTNMGAPLYFQQNMLEMLEETWPRVGKNLHDIRSDVSRAEWLVIPYAVKGERPTSSAQEKAKFVEEKIWGMKGNPIIHQNDFVETVYDLMDAYGKGISVMEIDWDPIRKNGEYSPLGTRWIRPNYYNQALLPQELDRLKLSPSGNPMQDLCDFPPNKFITGIYRVRSSPHAAKVSLLRSLAPWWVFTNFATEWLLQFGQIFGMPLRWATYQNKSDLPTIAKMLENMGAVSWGAFPFGTDIKLHESSQAATNNPNVYTLEYSDSLADIVILGQTLTTDVQKKTGSRSLGEVHERILTGRKKHAAMWASSVLTNQFAGSIINLNYGNRDEVPTIMPSIGGQQDPNLMAARDKILFVDMGLPVSQEYLYEEHGVPQPEADDTLFEPPVIPPPGGGAATAGPKGTAKPKNRTNEKPIKKGKTKPNRNRGVAGQPSRATPSAKPSKSRALAALEELEDGLEDGVIEALEVMENEDDVVRYSEFIINAERYQGPHYRKGQKGGGWFMSRKVLHAMDSVQKSMNDWPSEGQHRSKRHIKAFGLPDNEAEFRAYHVKGMADEVDKRARNIKALHTMDTTTLKTTQSTIDGEKVMGMLMSVGDDSHQLLKSPIVVKRGNKNWLWDGHHRVAKNIAMNEKAIACRYIDMEDYNG